VIMMKSVDVIINPDGSVKVTYSGFKGGACFEEAKRIYERLKALGVNVSIEKVTPTAEYYVSANAKGKVFNHV